MAVWLVGPPASVTKAVMCGIGRREVVRDEDGVVKQVAGEVDFVALSDKVVVDAADDLEHVLFAFAQVVVIDAVELGGKLVALQF